MADPGGGKWAEQESGPFLCWGCLVVRSRLLWPQVVPPVGGAPVIGTGAIVENAQANGPLSSRILLALMRAEDLVDLVVCWINRPPSCRSVLIRKRRPHIRLDALFASAKGEVVLLSFKQRDVIGAFVREEGIVSAGVIFPKANGTDRKRTWGPLMHQIPATGAGVAMLVNQLVVVVEPSRTDALTRELGRGNQQFPCGDASGNLLSQKGYRDLGPLERRLACHDGWADEDARVFARRGIFSKVAGQRAQLDPISSDDGQEISQAGSLLSNDLGYSLSLR